MSAQSQFYSDEERDLLHAQLEEIRQGSDAGVLVPKGTQIFMPAAEQPDTVKVLTAALKPFADAFEATGIPQYKGADEEHAGFLDENQITPVRGITMRQFRQAWEVLSGRSVLLGKEQA